MFLPLCWFVSSAYGRLLVKLLFTSACNRSHLHFQLILHDKTTLAADSVKKLFHLRIHSHCQRGQELIHSVHFTIKFGAICIFLLKMNIKNSNHLREFGFQVNRGNLLGCRQMYWSKASNPRCPKSPHLAPATLHANSRDSFKLHFKIRNANMDAAIKASPAPVESTNPFFGGKAGLAAVSSNSPSLMVTAWAPMSPHPQMIVVSVLLEPDTIFARHCMTSFRLLQPLNLA